MIFYPVRDQTFYIFYIFEVCVYFGKKNNIQNEHVKKSFNVKPGQISLEYVEQKNKRHRSGLSTNKKINRYRAETVIVK